MSPKLSSAPRGLRGAALALTTLVMASTPKEAQAGKDDLCVQGGNAIDQMDKTTKGVKEVMKAKGHKEDKKMTAAQKRVALKVCLDLCPLDCSQPQGVEFSVPTSMIPESERSGETVDGKKGVLDIDFCTKACDDLYGPDPTPPKKETPHGDGELIIEDPCEGVEGAPEEEDCLTEMIDEDEDGRPERIRYWDEATCRWVEGAFVEDEGYGGESEHPYDVDGQPACNDGLIRDEETGNCVPIPECDPSVECCEQLSAEIEVLRERVKTLELEGSSGIDPAAGTIEMVTGRNKDALGLLALGGLGGGLLALLGVAGSGAYRRRRERKKVQNNKPKQTTV